MGVKERSRIMPIKNLNSPVLVTDEFKFLLWFLGLIPGNRDY